MKTFLTALVVLLLVPAAAAHADRIVVHNHTHIHRSPRIVAGPFAALAAAVCPSSAFAVAPRVMYSVRPAYTYVAPTVVAAAPVVTWSQPAPSPDLFASPLPAPAALAPAYAAAPVAQVYAAAPARVLLASPVTPGTVTVDPNAHVTKGDLRRANKLAKHGHNVQIN